MPREAVMGAGRAAGGMIPVARPRLPPARMILPYLRRIDANGWYSNHGPLSKALQGRLAAHWGIGAGMVALLSSATSGLTLALLASGVRAGQRCLMPSWTFVASAGAVRQAGLVPHFVDVCPMRWVPDPADMQALAGRHDVGAILVVAPFGAPLDVAAWERVQAATGVPVVIDAAAAFDTLRSGGPMRLGACATVVSLHATKVFGVGEGGALLCRDAAVMERVRRLAQFGFLGTREAVVAGVNAKLSEYAAAVGLAGMDEWPETRARWGAVTAAYAAGLRGAGVEGSPGFDAGWVSSTLNVLGPDGGAMAKGLDGVGTLRWWGAGCHAQLAFADCPREALPVTEMLARRTIGLPFWRDMTAVEIEAVCRAFARSGAKSGATSGATSGAKLGSKSGAKSGAARGAGRAVAPGGGAVSLVLDGVTG